MARKSFPMHSDFYSEIMNLTNDQKSSLLDVMIAWASDDPPPESDPVVSVLSRLMIAQAERISSANAANGAIGGRPPKSEKSEKSEAKRKKATVTNAVTVPVTDTVANTPQKPPVGAEFDRFWSVYPKKVGKISARKAFEHVIRTVPLESLLTAVERQKCGRQWSRDNGQYIPNPATWLNQGRWEDEVPEETGACPQTSPQKRVTFTELAAKMQQEGKL